MDNQKAYQYIKTILLKGNFTSASETLFISQPSLSQFIKRIEDEIGSEILIRKAKPIKLTEAGEIFYSSLKQMNIISEKTLETIKEINNLEQGSINIGALNYHSITIISKVLEKFNKDYPNIKVNITEGSILELEQLANNGLVDFSLLIKPYQNPNLNFIELGYENVLIAMHKEHKIVKNKNVTYPQGKLYPYIDLNELKNENFIILTIEKRLRRSYEEVINMMSELPKSITETNDIINSLILASTGCGITFCPDILSEVFKNTLNAVYFKPVQSIKARKIVAGFNSSYQLSKSAEKFLKYLKNFFEAG